MLLRVTQCPGCESTFNTSAAQLQASAGTVRCGVCLTIFQAPQHFIDGHEFPAEGHDQIVDQATQIDSSAEPAGGFFTRLFTRKTIAEPARAPLVQTLVPEIVPEMVPEIAASEIASANHHDYSRINVSNDSAEIAPTVSFAGDAIAGAATEFPTQLGTAYLAAATELTALAAKSPEPAALDYADSVNHGTEEESVYAEPQSNCESIPQQAELADFSQFKKIDPVYMDQPEDSANLEEDIDLFGGVKPKILIQSKVALEIANRQSAAAKPILESRHAAASSSIDGNDLAFAPRPQSEIDPQKQRKIFVKPKDPAKDSGLVFIKSGDFELTRSQPVRRGATKTRPALAAVARPSTPDPAMASAEADLFTGVQVRAIASKTTPATIENSTPADAELVLPTKSEIEAQASSTNINAVQQPDAETAITTQAAAANDPLTDTASLPVTEPLPEKVEADQTQQENLLQREEVHASQASPESALSAVADELDPDAIRKIALSTEFEAESDLETLSPASLVAAESVTGALVLDAQAQRGRLFRTRSLLVMAPLFLVLAGLVLWQQMPRLSLQPELRPWYVAACMVLPCQVPVYADTHAIRSQNLSVRSHPQSNGMLAVTTVFRNEGNFPQPFPVLRLQFTDQYQKTVVQQEFQPSEYLDSSLQNIQMMPVLAPVQAELEIEDPGPEAVNYSLAFVSP